MIRGVSLPREAVWPQPPAMVHSIKLDFPPIEKSPHFLARINPSELVNAARCYNPSICQHQGRFFMAYRAEGYNAISKVAIAFLDKDLQVKTNGYVGGYVPLPDCPEQDAHWEDPHLASIGGRLYLMALFIRLVTPAVCFPRMFVIDPATLDVEEEVKMTFGKHGGEQKANCIEKNWTPFELPNGKPAFVYTQRPRLVVEVESRIGHESPGVPIAPTGCTISGRSSPIRLNEDFYLEFVGGWMRIPSRHGRYWFGAQLFEAKPPYRVTAYTPEPLMWGSEASPTIHSPRPNAGHPCCVFPAGAVLDSSDVVLSVGVNDSYCCLLRFSLSELLGRMVNVA